MKIAFLILAHGNIPQLNCFLRQLLKYEGSYVYIHLDIKAGELYKDIISDGRIKILPKRYDVQWGDRSQIDAVKYMIEYAFNDCKSDWYSVHSGVDMAIKPVSEFAQFLEKDNKFYYANYAKLPVNGWGFRGGYGRICLNWPKALRKRTGNHSWQRYSCAILGRLYGAGIIKGKPVPSKYTFYGGSVWFTLSWECVRRYISFLSENKDYDAIFDNSLCADEIYFNTAFEAVRNGLEACSNTHLRHIDWQDRGQKRSIGGPSTIAMSFVDEIINSGKFFARKFDLNFDKEVVEYLEKNC